MKSQIDIVKKFFQARYRHVQKRLRKESKVLPSNCRYNHIYKSKGGKRIGCCHYKSISGDDNWNVTICDSETPEGLIQAKKCPVYESLCKEDIENFVDHILLEGSGGEIAYEFPDLAALLWVLGEDKDIALDKLRKKSPDPLLLINKERDKLSFRPGGDVEYKFPQEEDKDTFKPDGE